MVKFKVRMSASSSDAPPAAAGSKKLLLCFAAMFVALSFMVLSAPAKDQEGSAKHLHTLGLKPHASAAEVKKAYRCIPYKRATPALTLLLRQLALRLHPDKHPQCTTCKQEFEAVVQA